MIAADAAAVEAWLHGFVRSDPPRGAAALEGAHALLADLGDPQDRVRAVHVVGTAGKGMVARLIAAELRRRGQTVGLHLSPHVHDVRERFTVAETLPSWADVAAAADEVQAAVDRGHEPTFFAVTTAMALVLARRAATDHLVIEAGIGGRHDATNTFHRSDVLTAVTAIGHDHEDVLGETIEEIAAHKADVLRGRKRAVIGPQPHARALEVIHRMAEAHDVEWLDVDATGDWRHDAAATARWVLRDMVADVDEVRFVDLPGRYETHDLGGRRWIFDGAHNPLKLAALAGSLQREPGPVVGIVALGAGKDVDACATALAPVLDRVVVTTFGPRPDEPGPRSHRAAVVAAAFRDRGVATAVADGAAAAVAATDGAATVIVTGSFLHLRTLQDAASVG